MPFLSRTYNTSAPTNPRMHKNTPVKWEKVTGENSALLARIPRIPKDTAKVCVL